MWLVSNRFSVFFGPLKSMRTYPFDILLTWSINGEDMKGTLRRIADVTARLRGNYGSISLKCLLKVVLEVLFNKKWWFLVAANSITVCTLACCKFNKFSNTAICDYSITFYIDLIFLKRNSVEVFIDLMGIWYCNLRNFCVAWRVPKME